MADQPSQVLRDLLAERKAACPHLADHFDRQFIIELHTRGLVSYDRMYQEARRRLGRPIHEHVGDPNQAEGDKLDDAERAAVAEIAFAHAARHFSPQEIERIIDLTIKRDALKELDGLIRQHGVSSRQLAERVAQFAELPVKDYPLPPSEVMGTRVALIRSFISDQLEFIGIAKEHLRVSDISKVAARLIDMEAGNGRIGGKAGGMVLAEKALATCGALHSDWPVHTPDSWFVRSDILGTFLELNNLTGFQSQKYKTIDDVRHEYPLIKGVLRNADFPVEVVQQLRAVLRATGTHPLIVRSSSLLEDRIGTAFSGKYASVFVANQGDLETRLQALLVAISEVYASTLGPDPIAYRREHHLLDYHEDMAVLIQKVVGRKVGCYFLPAFAGVAFSRNEYRWSPRIRREDGLMRLVMGLGTRAVDRVGSDYPRMVALGCPTLRPETTAREIMRYSQRTVDAINLETNRLVSVPLEELLRTGGPLPMLDRMVSIARDDGLYPPMGARVRAEPEDLYVTFEKLLAESSFADAVQRMLHRLEEVYGNPVDVEFACDGERFYLLQCRALAARADAARIELPTGIAPADQVLTANRYVHTGRLGDIEYVVYVNSRAYDAVATFEERIEIGRVIGRINRALAGKRFILVGPGRWGSNDIRLGVRVGYADINATQLLVEVARDKSGHVPELSFGTHFFQDLVEAGIHYLPLYPDEPGNLFSEAFFIESANALAEIAPRDGQWDHVVRVLHVPSIAGGRHLHIAMDGVTERALGYLQ
jgi:pyruvate,water dikinase